MNGKDDERFDDPVHGFVGQVVQDAPPEQVTTGLSPAPNGAPDLGRIEAQPRPLIRSLDEPIDDSGMDEVIARFGESNPVVRRLQELGFGFVALDTGKKVPPNLYGRSWPEAIARTNILKTLRNPGTTNAAMTPPAGVVGLDNDKGAPDLLRAKEAVLGPLPATLKVISPHGEHLFYRWPESLPEPHGLWWGSVVARWDFRTTTHDGGYTVAPGSVTADGAYTLWFDEQEHDPYDIAELPEAWARDVLTGQGVQTHTVAGGPDGPRDGQPLVERRAHYELPVRVEEGNRYPSILAYTASLYNRGFSLEEMWSQVRATLAPRFAVAYPPGELRASFERATDDIEQRLGPPMSVSGVTSATPDASVGSRTAADLSFSSPPAPLVDDTFLAAEGWTVLYANGGTGKGFVSAWLIAELVKAGHVVMVIDYEGHESEWGFRLRGLGLTELELLRVHYREPFGSDWTAPKDDLAKVWMYLRADAERLGVTYFVVDSYTMAADPGAELGGAEAAKAFFGAAGRLGPGLVIAHTSGDMRFPPKPFGSRFVHNIPRETWALERVEGPAGAGTASGLVTSAVIELEARNMKRAAGEKSRPQFIAFEVFASGHIDVRRGTSGTRPIADLVDGILSAEGAMDTRALAAAIKEDTGQVVDTDTVRRVLERWPAKFAKDTSKRPHLWAVKEVEED